MAHFVRSRTLASLVTAASAIALLPASANAQPVAAAAATNVRWAKTDAILGGTPSALQAILAQQQGLPAPASARAPTPASYSLPPLTRAVVVQTAAEPSAGAISGKPDVFGSIALKIASTRLDARWRSVERARIGGPAARYAESLADVDRVERLEAINRYVNRRVQFTDDVKQYGRADVWSTAADTLSRGRGDCEDYAIAKLQMLRHAGFSDRDLYLVIVKDLVGRADHAVLVARAEGRMYVLDNGTERLLESDSIRDYRPVLTFAAGGRWTHGYRMRSAPVDIASADDRIARRVAPAADNQRSWSASLLAFNTGFSR